MDGQKVGGREGGREGGWMGRGWVGRREGGKEGGIVMCWWYPSHPLATPLSIPYLPFSSLPHSVLLLQEFYGDYIAVAQHLFSFNIEQCAQPGLMWRREEFLRVCDGLVSVLLALRKKPLIR